MKTAYLDLKGREPKSIDLKAAGEILKSGGLVAFPTETVYGLGGNGLDSSAAKKIYEAKGRPSDNPLILHISDISELSELVLEIPIKAEILARKYWPGPLTMVFQKSDKVPFETTGGLQTVAVRLPANEIARALIKEAGVPVAAPSANRSGRPSPTKAEHVKEDLDGIIDMIIDGGAVGIGLESTIIDVTGEEAVILRPGFITEEMLSALFSEIKVDEAVTSLHPDKNLKPKAPGMKYRHYAPKGKLVIYDGDREEMRRRINEEAAKAKKEGFVTAVLATEENKSLYQADHVVSLGSAEDLPEIARNLFDALRTFDEIGAERIYAENIKGDGLAFAIMNRLRKAAGYNIISTAKE